MGHEPSQLRGSRVGREGIPCASGLLRRHLTDWTGHISLEDVGDEVAVRMSFPVSLEAAIHQLHWPLNRRCSESACSRLLRLPKHHPGELDARADVQLPEYLAQVERDGMHAHVHPVGYLPIVQSLRDEFGCRALGLG